jgi:hypothetical protein
MADRRLLAIAGGIKRNDGGGVVIPSEDDMAKMSWADLQDLRTKAGADTAKQMQIAPYEHRAYAREQVSESPLRAPLYAVMPAGYQVAKAVGAIPTDEQSTPPSMKQMVEGMKGAYEGASTAVKRRFSPDVLHASIK